MSKQLSSFLHFAAIVFTGLAAAMTLLGGIGTTCVAFSAEKFGPRMAALIPVKPIFQVLVVVSIFARARAPSITSAQQGEALQPFCGALMRMSTPVAAISTQIVPEAMQSSTNRPPTACTASATARR